MKSEEAERKKVSHESEVTMFGLNQEISDQKTILSI